MAKLHYLPVDRLGKYKLSHITDDLCIKFNKDKDEVTVYRRMSNCWTCKSKEYDFEGSQFIFGSEFYELLLRNDKG